MNTDTTSPPVQESNALVNETNVPVNESNTRSNESLKNCPVQQLPASDVEELTKHYDGVIDIRTMIGCIFGWYFYGDASKLDFSKTPVPLIGVYGTFKSGKSYILSKIIGVETIANHIFHTPGICIKAKIKEKTNNRFANPLDGPQLEYAFMDAAGGNVASKEMYIDDQRAVEYFNKEVIYGLCSTVLLVTTKFTREDQYQIRSLLKTYKTKFNQNNKLLVVHNLMEVIDVNVFFCRVDELKATYGEGELIYRDLDPDQQGKFGFTCFESKTVRHLFFVQDDPSNEFCKEFNADAIKAIRTIFSTGAAKTNINVIEQFCALSSDHLLEHFLEGFNRAYHHLVFDEKKKMFKIIPTDGSDDAYKIEVDPKTGLYVLRKILYHEYGIINEDDIDLNPNSFVYFEDKEQQYHFEIPVAGLPNGKIAIEGPKMIPDPNCDYIKMYFNQKEQTIRLEIVVIQEHPSNMKPMENYKRNKRRIFEWREVNQERTLAITDIKQVSDTASVENGMLKFKIKLSNF